MNIWVVIFAVINIVLFLHTSYYVIFTIYGLLRRTKKYAETDERKHFAAVIAARNEELVIGNLVDSLKATDYPPELLDIYVFLNNCSDRTGEIAEAHGAKVVECKDEAHSKGDVLRYAFNKFFKEKSCYCENADRPRPTTNTRNTLAINVLRAYLYKFDHCHLPFWCTQD